MIVHIYIIGKNLKQTKAERRVQGIPHNLYPVRPLSDFATFTPFSSLLCLDFFPPNSIEDFF